MQTSLKIHDQAVGGFRTADNSLVVTVTGETITARELIVARVRQEAAQYNQQRPEYFRMLVQPSDAERTLNGLKLPHSRTIDPEAQAKKALEAFNSNGFILLVGDRQVESLDETIVLQPDLEVTFLKLVPLVGG